MARSVADCARGRRGDGGRGVRAARSPRRSRACGSAFRRACLLDECGQHGRHALRRGAQEARRCRRALTDEPMPLLDEMLAVNAKGGFAPAEAYAIHRERLDAAAPTSSIRTSARASSAAATSRRRLRRHDARARAAGARDGRAAWPSFDALVLPTTPIVAPTIAEMQDTDDVRRQEHAAAAQHARPGISSTCARSRMPMPRQRACRSG